MIKKNKEAIIIIVHIKRVMMKKKAGKSLAGTGNNKTNLRKPKSKSGSEGLKKRYLSSKNICKVTFRLPREAAPDARNVTIVGDFNNWNITETKMKKLSNGDFTLTLELPCDREYSFRYLIDANRWEKDWFADKHIPGDSGVDDSVVVV